MMNNGLLASTTLSLLISIAVALTACTAADQMLLDAADSVSGVDPVTGERQISLMDEQEEVSRASAFSQELLSRSRASGIRLDEQLTEYGIVNKVFSRLLKVVHRKHLPWELHLIDKPDFNAFTVGGGKIFAYRGLFSSALGVRNEAELAAVLAHEMAHVTARHASEGQGKLLIAKMFDKGARNRVFDASFTTIQEDEADRYSVLYLALAGYDPMAGAAIWDRFHASMGSHSDSLLHDHPLNAERAANIRKYAKLARQYYRRGMLNPDHERVLANNDLYRTSSSDKTEVGEGAGVVAVLDTLASSYSEINQASREKKRRTGQQHKETDYARSAIYFENLQLAQTPGGYVLKGQAINRSGRGIQQAVISLNYYVDEKIVKSSTLQWRPLAPGAIDTFTIKLEDIRFSRVDISPVYVAH